MKKHFTNLRIALVGFLVCLMSMSMMAQNVTLDFSVNDWGLATSSAEGGTAAQSFTNTDGYSVTLFATTKYYYYNNTYTDDHYYCLMLGKTNSTLTLPAFDFDVEKIEETVTSYLVVGIIFVRNSIQISFCRHGLMERSIKYAYMFHIGQQFLHHLDTQ